MKRTSSTFALILLMLTGNGFSTEAAEPEAVFLWPGGAPGAKGDSDADKPCLFLHQPDANDPKRTDSAVVICPGGGYGGVVMTYEGNDIGKWFAARGVTAAVLRYRYAPRYQHPAPMQDVTRAIRHLRAHSKELHLDTGKIGVMGFSAGGHLAATAATHMQAGDKDAADPLDRVSSRPDFLILAYPVITMGEFTHAGSRLNLLGPKPDPALLKKMSLEHQVQKNTPPTFLFHTDGDKAVPSENSILFYQALRKATVPAELHIFREGGHGVGLDRHPASKSWPGLLETWLARLGLLNNNGKAKKSDPK